MIKKNNKYFLLISCLSLMIFSDSVAQFKNVNFYGYAQLDYKTSTNKTEFSGFNQRRLNLISEFNYYQRLRILADVEYEGGVDVSLGDSTSFGVIKLSRAIIEYSFLPELKFSAGKMLSHFGLYNLIHDASASYYSVDPPLMYSKLNPVTGQPAARLFGKYLIGISLLGTFDIDNYGGEIEYFIGIGNGRGLDNNGNDKNNNRAINARIIYRPSFLYGLQIGSSFYNDINFNGVSGLENANESSYAFDLQYENSNAQLQIESMYSSFELINRIYQNSWISYIQLAYTFDDIITPFANYSLVNYNLNSDDNKFTRLNLGVNYAFLTNLFLKGEIQFHSTEEEISAQESYTVIKATIAVAF